jgi:hypothetical protein
MVGGRITGRISQQSPPSMEDLTVSTEEFEEREEVEDDL